MKITEIDEFTKHYLICALWSSAREDLPDDQNPGKFTLEDIHPDSVQSAYDDCQRFQKENGVPEYHDSRYSDAEKAGHDFWLTRNHHGVGFWDRNELDEATQKKLTDAANAFGECDAYIGDDKKIHLQ